MRLINFRINEKDIELIKEASKLDGRCVSSFVRVALRNSAKKIIKKNKREDQN